MLDSIDELEPLLKGSALENLKFERIDIPGTGSSVLAAEVLGVEPFVCWHASHALLDATGRWPLLVELQFSELGSGFEGAIVESILSRFPYEDPDGNAPSAQSIIEASNSIDVETYFAHRAKERNEDDEDFEWIVDEIEAEIGRRPEAKDLDASIPSKEHRIDRWAYEQQLQTGTAADPAEGRPPLFEPQQPVLLLMPTACGWETLAWASWYGAEGADAEAIAVLRAWEKQYGAKLYANYSTMLEFEVEQPPHDPLEAWSLAVEHDLLAPCNLALPGLPVRQYAQGLIGHDRWFLHERP